uniref:Transmembrane protein n=1 Tax=Oryza nivara TaxID=4536 RepID=A0A0E0J8H8_ORYNI
MDRTAAGLGGLVYNKDNHPPDIAKGGDPKEHENGNSSEVEESLIIEDRQSTVANINMNSEALRKRVQSFTEGLVKMASPVLLALKMNKVDLRSKGNAFIRGSISSLVAAILEVSIFLFLWLWLCSSQLLKDKKRKFMYTMSKMLVHFCGMLLMALASCILLLIIGMDKKLFLLILVPFLCITFLSIATSAMRSEDDDASLHEEVKCEDELERSVDFSASITALVFLGLGRFAFEVDDPQKADVSEHLAVAAIISFVICVLGVFFTLYGTIPLLPSINALRDMELMEGGKAQEHVREKLEMSSMVLAATVLGIVAWITWVILKLWACLLTIPLLASLFAGIYNHIIKQLQNRDSEPKKPQSAQDPARVINPAQPQGVVEGQRKPPPASSGETSAGQTTATSIPQPQPAGTGSSSGETRSTTLELHSTSSEVTSAGQTTSTAEIPPGTSSSSVDTRPASDEHPATSTSGEEARRTAHDETTTVTSSAAQSESQPDTDTTSSGETKAAPLELTKATFTAFLLVAIPSFGDSSIHGYTHAFIFLTAAALVSGLLLRLLTHRTVYPPSVVRAAKVASFFAHLCLAAAVIPFTLMAIAAQKLPPSCTHTCAGAANTTSS